MKTYSISETSKLTNRSKSDLKKLIDYKRKEKEFNILKDAGITDIEIVFSLSYYDNVYYIEHPEIQIAKETTKIPYYINFWDRYGYSINSFKNYQNVSHSVLLDIDKKTRAKQQVNKPTPKKIQNLLDLAIKRDELLSIEDEKVKNKETEFLKKLDLFIEKNRSKIKTILIDKDRKRGWLITDSLEYSFSIEKDYIGEKIEYRGSNDLESFEKLL